MTSLEQEILNRIKNGDSRAFEIIFKNYYPALCSFAFDFLKQSDLAEDVVHETLIKFWESRSIIEVSNSLKAYLYKSVRNNCINYLKHSQVIKNLADKYTEDVQANVQFTLISEAEYTLDYYFYDGMEQDMQNVISELPDQCRTIFQLSRVEHLHHEQIANKLNISVNTVKTQISRALEKLRTIIGKKIADHQKRMDSEMGLTGFIFWLMHLPALKRLK